MRLHKIRLEQIRSYVSEEIVFPQGKVLLWGNIGSGKSSILYAIDFVLFGLQRAELAGASLLRNGSDEGSVELFFSIEEKDYVLKRVLKRTKNGVVQDSGYIIREGIKEEKTALELKQIILELLHYPKELITKNKTLIYRYTVYTPQEEMKTILLGPEEERLDTLRKVFGVDKYKRIRENAKILMSELKEKKKIYEGASADLQEKILEQEIKEKEKRDLEQKYSSFFPTYQETERTFQTKKEHMIFLETKKQELIELQKELAVCSIQITQSKTEQEQYTQKSLSLQKEIAFLSEDSLQMEEGILERCSLLDQSILAKEKGVQEMELQKEQALLIQKELAVCHTHITHAYTEREECLKKDQTLQEEIDKLSEEAAEKEEDTKGLIEQCNTRILVKEKELRDILNKAQEWKTKKDHALFIKSKIESLNTCPTCFQEVASTYKQMIVEGTLAEVSSFDKELLLLGEKQIFVEKEKQSEKENLESLRIKEQNFAFAKIKKEQQDKKREEKTLLQKKLLDLQNTYIYLQAQKEDLEKKEQLFNTLDSHISSQKQDLERIRQERDDLRKQEQEAALILLKKQHLEKKKEEYVQILELKVHLEKRLLEKTLLQTDLTKKQETLLPFETLYLPLKQEIEQIQQKMQQLHIEKAQIDISLKHVQLLLEHLNQDIQKKKILREKKESLTTMHFWLSDHFIPLMETMEKNILFQVHAEFNALFEKWFALLIDNQTLSMCLDENYSPKITQNGYDIAYEYLSGGEKTAGALAYRLALNQVINNLNVGLKTEDLLILDEPTDGFSSEQLDRLKILMDEIQIPQIILVSHEAQIECFADHIIRFEKREHSTKIVS